MLNLGIPKQRKPRAKELFPDTEVMTMELDKGKRFGKRFNLNSKALDALEFDLTKEDQQIAFSFEGDLVMLVNVSGKGLDSDAVLKLSQKGTFLDSKSFSHIAKVLELDTSKDTYFEFMDNVQHDEDLDANWVPLMLMEVSEETEEPAESKLTLGVPTTNIDVEEVEELTSEAEVVLEPESLEAEVESPAIVQATEENEAEEEEEAEPATKAPAVIGEDDEDDW